MKAREPQLAQICQPQRRMMNLPDPKLEYDTFHQLVLLTVHNSYDITCEPLQKVFLGREYVVIVDGSTDSVSGAGREVVGK